MSTEKNHFEQGFKPDPQQQQVTPGLQSKLQPSPAVTHLPSAGTDKGYERYRAAGKLEGKKALITGGDSGIGAAAALLFAMEGADVSIAFLPEEDKDAQDISQRIKALGRNCFAFSTDLKSSKNCKSVVENAVRQMGGINILVNNAATQRVVEDIQDLSEEQWETTFQTNIHPYFFLSKYCLQHMHEGDTIINLASINPYTGRSDMLDYTSTKGAIVAFTRALSNQVVGKGIRVNAVCPGPIWTPLIPATMPPEKLEAFGVNSPMGRPGQPSEVATCIVFLASTDSSFVSGQSLHVNGGKVVNS